jgi:hypothetical protein
MVSRIKGAWVVSTSLTLLATLGCSDSQGPDSGTGGSATTGGQTGTGGQQANGGIGGANGNACALPQYLGAAGRCAAIIPRFWHNPETKECEPFDYGGCNATANHFETLAACQAACEK